jgi:hypothetical protein
VVLRRFVLPAGEGRNALQKGEFVRQKRDLDFSGF